MFNFIQFSFDPCFLTRNLTRGCCQQWPTKWTFRHFWHHQGWIKTPEESLWEPNHQDWNSTIILLAPYEKPVSYEKFMPYQTQSAAEHMWCLDLAPCHEKSNRKKHVPKPCIFGLKRKFCYFITLSCWLLIGCYLALAKKNGMSSSLPRLWLGLFLGLPQYLTSGVLLHDIKSKTLLICPPWYQMPPLFSTHIPSYTHCPTDPHFAVVGCSLLNAFMDDMAISWRKGWLMYSGQITIIH